MNYYEEDEEKNQDFVELWMWSMTILALGGAIFWIGRWFVRLLS